MVLFVLMSGCLLTTMFPRCSPDKRSPQNVDNATVILTKTKRVRLRSRGFDEQARDWRLEPSPNQWQCTRFHRTQGACLE